jgi:hypothetical protein
MLKAQYISCDGVREKNSDFYAAYSRIWSEFIEYGLFSSNELLAKYGNSLRNVHDNRELILNYSEIFEIIRDYEEFLKYKERPDLLHNFLADKVSKISNSEYLNNTSDTAAKEISYFVKKHISKIVMVGCGPTPTSIFTYAKAIGSDDLRIIGIDYSFFSINCAKELLALLGTKYSKMIDFVNVDGDQYDSYNDVDLIIVANSVRRKYDVINRIASDCKAGAYIAVRNPINLTKIVFEEITDRSGIGELINCGVVQVTEQIGNCTLLLKKVKDLGY